MFKNRIIFSFILLSFFTSITGKAAAQGFDKPAYYSILSADNIDEINSQLALIKTASFAEKDAYEGTLLMKKAGLVKTTKEKLSLFKSGRSKLESVISKNKTNTEYRFLRLIIQENAPKVVKYRNEIEEDSQLVRSNYKNLPQFLQQVIADYSKKSKALKNQLAQS